MHILLVYNNYNITVQNGTLTVVERETYIVASDIEQFYNTKIVEFSAKLFGDKNGNKIGDSLGYLPKVNLLKLIERLESKNG